MSPISFLFRPMVKFKRLRRLAKGDNKYDTPVSPILLLSKCKTRLERLKKLAKGDNRDYALMCSI